MKSQNQDQSPQQSKNQNDNEILSKDSNIPENNNSISNSINNNNNNNKIFIITETESEIFIENTLYFNIIKISKDNPSQITKVYSKNEISNPKQTYNADGIIGIISLNETRYLGIIISSKDVANIQGKKIYVINSIELIKITSHIESEYYLKLKDDIKDLFSTKNFYFSFDYKLFLPQQHDEGTNEKYLINYLLIKPFIDNNISDIFYNKIIFGYVSSINNINLVDDINVDIIIIERYFNRNINIAEDTPIYVKQIEYITVFKNSKSNAHKIFSSVFFMSSEYINVINKFHPVRTILIDELNKFNSIFCIINNLNYQLNTRDINSRIAQENTSYLNKKIVATNFSSSWKKIFFEGIDIKNNTDFYFNASAQKVVFWFIDINNLIYDNKICHESFRRLFWNSIREALRFQNINLDIGIFDTKNEGTFYKTFEQFTKQYLENINNFRNGLLFNPKKNKFQEIIDKILNSNNNNNNPLIKGNNINGNNKSENVDSLNMLFVTWNAGGSTLKDDYNISELFTQNYFYKEGQAPDMIIISIQEIVKLNMKNTLKLKNNTDILKYWKQRIARTIAEVFPKVRFIQILDSDLVGLYITIFGTEESLKHIKILDFTETKKGKLSLGNKGFFTCSFKYFDKSFSVASGHLESGLKKNKKRIETLKEILNKPINLEKENKDIFVNSDFWVILGDLNFRIEMSYEDAIGFIQEKNFQALNCMDQFNLAYEEPENIFIKQNLMECPINFEPTYKYEINSDIYAFDEEKIRVPAYCDRIFCSKKKGVRVLSYNSIKNIKLSDHRPVTGAFRFNIGEDNEKKEGNIEENKNDKDNNHSINKNIKRFLSFNQKNNYNISNSNINNMKNNSMNNNNMNNMSINNVNNFGGNMNNFQINNNNNNFNTFAGFNNMNNINFNNINIFNNNRNNSQINFNNNNFNINNFSNNNYNNYNFINSNNNFNGQGPFFFRSNSFSNNNIGNYNNLINNMNNNGINNGTNNNYNYNYNQKK